MISIRLRQAVVTAVYIGVLAACSTTAPVKHFVLESVPPAQPASALEQLTIGVGPVELPGYLDRAEWVSRGAAGELTIAASRRWAEPLGEALARALSEGLVGRLGVQRLLLFPWPRGAAPDYQVALQVWRFEPQPDGTLALDAAWTLRRAAGGGSSVEVEQRHAVYRQPLAGLDAPARAAAQNRTVAALCDDVAAAIRADAAKR